MVSIVATTTVPPANLAPGQGHHTGFRADVEGLRAAAVVLVLLYHAKIGDVSGGFVGVDVFFVISGFLITSLLLREAHGGGTPSIRNFYARRARRILPAAFVVMVAVILTSYHWLGFIRADHIARDARWSAVFLANFRFASLNTDYFNSIDPPSPLQHYWSLAVEEQFYIVWPLLFIGVTLTFRRYPLRTRLVVLLVPLLAASFIWSVVHTERNATAAFFSPLTRAWEIGVGALLAIAVPAVRRIPGNLAGVLSWVGLILIGWSAVAYDASTKFPGAAALMPVAGTLCCLGGGSVPQSWDPRVILCRAPVLWIGRLSYSLYLWHWPLIAMVAEYHGEPQGAAVNATLILIALALSVLSYYMVERPVRFSRLLSRRPNLSVALGGVLVLSTVALATWTLSRHQGIF